MPHQCHEQTRELPFHWLVWYATNSYKLAPLHHIWPTDHPLVHLPHFLEETSMSFLLSSIYRPETQTFPDPHILWSRGHKISIFYILFSLETTFLIQLNQKAQPTPSCMVLKSLYPFPIHLLLWPRDSPIPPSGCRLDILLHPLQCKCIAQLETGSLGTAFVLQKARNQLIFPVFQARGNPKGK